MATPEAMRRSQQSEFIQYCRKGMPASQVDPKLVDLLVGVMLAVPIEKLVSVGPVAERKPAAMLPHVFVICAEHGEVTVERCARVKGVKIVCTPPAPRRGEAVDGSYGAATGLGEKDPNATRSE